MAAGVNYARQLEANGTEKKKSGIRLSNSPHPVKFGKLLAALVTRDFNIDERDVDDEQKNTGILRRPPFLPNYETNAVFIFSLLQSVLVNVLNHEGKPFYQTILENRDICVFSLFTTLFSLALVLESFPLVNHMLELRPLPSSKSKVTFVGIAALNVAACVFCQVFSGMLFGEKMDKSLVETRKKKIAADKEEELLQEESKENLKLVYLAVFMGTYLVFTSL